MTINSKEQPSEQSLGLRQRGLVEEYSHAGVNTLPQTNNNQDRRSIDEDTVAKRQVIINDNVYKQSVFDRLRGPKTNSTKTNRESKDQRELDQHGQINKQ